MDSFISESDFQGNLELVQKRIHKACADCGRTPSSVTLLPVTKTHPVEAALMAHRAGMFSVGENRVQEAQAKRPEAPDSLRWELIGHLQSNKSRQAVECFDRIQSVDSEKLLERLDRAASEIGKTLPILLQFNTGRDPGKFGAPPEHADKLVEKALSCKNLLLDGLMTIGPLTGGRKAAQSAFAELRNLRDSLEQKYKISLPVLSMGMTGDLEEAIAEGSTLIRVGTALFGQRPYGQTH